MKRGKRVAGVLFGVLAVVLLVAAAGDMTVGNDLTVSGVVTVGSGAEQITTAAGKLDGAALDAGSVALAALAVVIGSGQYTPTLREGANVASSSAGAFRWIRIGDEVFVGGRLTVTPTADATTTRVGIPLPVASTFSGDDDKVSGMGSCELDGVQPYGKSNVTFNDAQFSFESNGTGAHELRVSFSYSIF